MDIFNLTFTGNLTADAISSNYQENKKKVYNFTVAVNVTKNNTMFMDVAYWMSDNFDQEAKLLEKLKKGTPVTVQSHYAAIKNSVNEETGKSYESLSITASNLKL